MAADDHFTFCMSEIHFRLHSWTFQIDMKLQFFEIFDIMAAVGCPKFIFYRISGHSDRLYIDLLSRYIGLLSRQLGK